MARKYDWQLVISTHAEEVIAAAYEHEALIVLNRHRGVIQHYPADQYGLSVVSELVTQPAVDLLLFCEDESAAALVRALLQSCAPDLLAAAVVSWKDGDGYLRKLAQHLPRTDASSIRFALIFDGDQRDRRETGSPRPELKRWPSLYLPTTDSPDALFRSAKDQPELLQRELGCAEVKLSLALSALEGCDDHDWVNGLCDRVGPRTQTLDSLASLWVRRNDSASRQFCSELRSSLPGRPG